MSTPLTARILEEHANASRALPPTGPAATRRRTAIAALTASGLPTSRDENWKYANLRPLERLRFAPATPAQPGAALDLPAAIPGFARYVFVDGAFAPALSARLDASAATVTPLVDCAVAMATLGVMLAWYRVAPGAPVVWLPLLILLAVATAFAVALWLSALMVVYRDVAAPPPGSRSSAGSTRAGTSSSTGPGGPIA